MHSIFNPTPSFTMTGPKVFVKYVNEQAALAKEEENTADEIKDFERECTRGWVSLIGRPNARVELNDNILTPELLELIDECNVTHFGGISDYFLTLHDTWSETMVAYTSAINELLDTKVASQVYKMGVDNDVAKQVMVKLSWIYHDHSPQSDIPTYPLLTKGTIHMITMALKHVQRAAEEVRISFIMLFPK